MSDVSPKSKKLDKLKLFNSNVTVYSSDTWKVTATSSIKFSLISVFLFYLNKSGPGSDTPSDSRGNDKFAEQALDWSPQGSRKHAKPRRTW